MKRVIGLLAACAAIFFVLLPGMGQAQLVLYDNFNSALINPAKWFGSQSQPGAAAPMTETSRKIVEGQLLLQVTDYGDNTSDTGRAPTGTQSLRVNDPSTVTAMQARVTVQGAVAQACSTNTGTTGQARAGIFGDFFNDGSSTGSGDETGDVRASFLLTQQSDGTKIILASVTRCTDAGCDNFTTIDSNTFTKKWAVGAAQTLKIEWDPANDQFFFTLNPGTAGQEGPVSLSYAGFSDADPPGNDRKQLQVQSLPLNCTATRTKASIAARFDNVMLDS
jgi:hypothetical protein